MVKFSDKTVNRLRILHRHHPDLSWSIISFAFLFSVLFAVHWSESSPTDDFDYNETMEMIEFRISAPENMGEIIESTESAEPDIDEAIEEKKLFFGSESSDFSELENSSIPPRPLFLKTPPYPDSMRKAGIEGVVTIELGINENGNVVYGKIVRSLGKDFDVAVIDWAKKLRFYPAKNSDCTSMKCRVLLPVRFKLDS